jgi:hypothetical protein
VEAQHVMKEDILLLFLVPPLHGGLEHPSALAASQKDPQLCLAPVVLLAKAGQRCPWDAADPGSGRWGPVSSLLLYRLIMLGLSDSQETHHTFPLKSCSI